ncbi:Translin [Aureobasidium pullulans]|uniref:Translin n=1 Tax=Aureobasidium pullulans TaxID=5580 RepID=A0A4S9XA25_AURPU|nr:Translin [Aureobasidium pullulans]THV85234.1 Translin [Aureobasidium pullulans]THW18273.1 Translin [Aureobasidium pullulans]THW25691.1 Translin [Aureobasidium pullulans]THW64230.1 Translin [Aureobasidium pullulans]
MSGGAQGLLQPQIFESLQKKIDEETEVRDSIREIVQTLEKQDRSTQAILSRAHSSSNSELPAVVSSAQESINKEVESIAKLSDAASKYPYYKYNGMWTRHVQDASFSILLCGYLGGFSDVGSGSQDGRLLTIEEVGKIMNIPVNVKDRDVFHLTIEEYLQSLISLIDELARLARNSVTQGDYSRPVHIAKFIKHLHAGFQILNLKNDSLRKRSDGIKYRVKEVEDVVYDLSLRGLTPKE